MPSQSNNWRGAICRLCLQITGASAWSASAVGDVIPLGIPGARSAHNPPSVWWQPGSNCAGHDVSNARDEVPWIGWLLTCMLHPPRCRWLPPLSPMSQSAVIHAPQSKQSRVPKASGVWAAAPPAPGATRSSKRVPQARRRRARPVIRQFQPVLGAAMAAPRGNVALPSLARPCAPLQGSQSCKDV